MITGMMIALLLSPVFAFAQDIRFEAMVDKRQISLEDVLVLSFVVEGGNINLNVTPELPDLEADFDVLQGPGRSTSISIINGQQSSSLSLQYVLSPKKTGTLTIGSATLQYNNNTYTTQPITIEVVQGTPPQSSPQPGEESTDAGPDVFIRAEADKQTAYIGEQITLSYSLYTRVNIAGYDFTQQPGFTGFWVEELEIPKPPRLERQTVNGVEYGVALMKKVALFPTSSGNLTIDPMVMALSVRVQTRARDPFGRMFDDPFDNFFNRTQDILRKTQPLDLTILPLPEDQQPDSFTGSVGSFTMSAEVDNNQVTQDEPITLTIKVQGTGNIKTVKEPVVTLPDSFKRYDPEITENIFPNQEPLQGEKVFKSVIIPSAAGEFHLAPVQFSYFDSQRKSYWTIRSRPMTLVVQPKADADQPLERHIATKEEIKLLGQDIRFIKTEIPQLVQQGAYWHQTGLFHVLLVLPLIAVAAAYGYKRYHRKYASDARYVRRKNAKKLSRTHLKTAQAFMQQGNTKEFYAAISTALCQYLGDKWNVPPASIEAEEAGRRLVAHGLDEQTAHLLKACLAECDFARFAPVGGNVAEMRAMLHNAESIIARIEKLNIGAAKSNAQSIKTLILFLLAPISMYLLLAASSPVPCFAAATAPEELFRQGNKFYEDGHYQEAATYYQRILEAGIDNGYVYYNLGNALLKERQIGAAILAYERAKRRLPRDEDVAFNLDYARALTLDKMEGWDSGKLARLGGALRDSFTPNEMSVLLAATYLIVIVIVIALLFTTRRWRRRLMYAAILPVFLLILSGILLFAQHAQIASVSEAIILVPTVAAKTGPGEGYSTVFEIHEGAKVRIQRAKLDWVEIKLPNKVIGWIKKADLETIF